MRGAEAKRARRVEDEQGFAPTPQTVAKLRTDVVQRLHRQGRLTIEQLQAAEEIRRLWQAVGRGLFPTAGRLDGAGRAPPGQPRHPVDRMTKSEDRAFRRRYRPWAAEIGARPDGIGGRAGRLQLVYDMVIDNYGPRQLERAHRLRHGMAVALVRAALQRYAEIAQWVRPAPNAPVADWRVLRAGL